MFYVTKHTDFANKHYPQKYTMHVANSG